MCRLFYWIMVCLLIFTGCSTKQSTELKEHEATAAMAYALAATLYMPDDNGSLRVETKLLPWEANMPLYVLSFLPIGSDVTYDFQIDHGIMLLDIAHFPVFDDAKSEQCAVASIVNTLLSLPDIDCVELRFDGEQLVSLKNGTVVGEPFETLIAIA
ncbi:MAG: GerMN domain-containing protein [Clostridia bacterium]